MVCYEVDVAARLNKASGDKLRGKSAIVTGGSSGIGQGIVHYLTKNGVKVLIGDLKEPSEPIAGPIFQQCDAGSWSSQLGLFKRAEKEFGRIDIVVPNAGFGDRGDYFDKINEQGDPVEPEFACLKVGKRFLITGLTYLAGHTDWTDVFRQTCYAFHAQATTTGWCDCFNSEQKWI